MKMKHVSMLAGGAAALLASSVFAAELCPAGGACLNAGTTVRGGNIFPGDDLLYYVYDEQKLMTLKVRNGHTGVLENYRLILVKDTGITGPSYSSAAMARESAGGAGAVSAGSVVELGEGTELKFTISAGTLSVDTPFFSYQVQAAGQ